MQTFLPYEDFARSASVLDVSRLHNQINEALVVMATALRLRRISNLEYEPVGPNEKLGWQSHPAVKMWHGAGNCLGFYTLCMMRELRARNHPEQRVREADPVRWCRLMELWSDRSEEGIRTPTWLGNADFHRSHQSNLIRKYPGHYAQFFPGVPDSLPYIWHPGFH